MRVLVCLAVGMCAIAFMESVFSLAPRREEAIHARPVPAAPQKGDPAKIPRISRECQQSIDDGTKWLLSALSRRGVGPDINQPFDLSCTAMCGLALLSQGNTPHGGPHASELTQILDIVLMKVDDLPSSQTRSKQSSLVQRKIGRNADLFFAALFLSQTYGDSGGYEKEIRLKLEKLIDVIAGSQDEDGTWGDESWAPILGTVMGWESLRAASSCGLKVNASADLAGQSLLAKLKAKNPQQSSWMHDFYKTASTIRVLHSTDHRHEEAYIECVRQMILVARMDDRPFLHAGGEEYLAFYLVTECLLQEDREDWHMWYPLVRDRLVKHQNRDGSWSGHHCITARTFCTAAALMTLQAPKRSLPISDL